MPLTTLTPPHWWALPLALAACACGGASPSSMPDPHTRAEPSSPAVGRLGAEVGSAEAVALADATLCQSPEGPGLEFSDGPYGTQVWDIAADFTVPTLEGDFTLSDRFTGCESYAFMTWTRGWAYSTSLWNTRVRPLLEGSPDDVHYFVVSYSEGAAADEDIAQAKALFDKALSRMPASAREHWATHLHFVTAGVSELDNWVEDRMMERHVFAWGIDRLQRVREAGLLYDVGVAGITWKEQIHALANEPLAWNFEFEREQRLAAEQALVVPVFEQTPASDPGWSGQSVSAAVSLPSGSQLASYDTLEVDLGLYCTDHKDENCPEWDYLVYLWVCDAQSPERCETLLARWVTPYGREGRWVTDVSGLLPLLGSGGSRTLRFYTQQPYLVDLSLRFSHRGKVGRPAALSYLFSGGTFNATYNDAYTPKTVTVPSSAVRVELMAMISGHGFGDDANCAEFCNHDHHFYVGSREHVKDHPEAGTSHGCTEEVGEGVVPNQFGTWFYGRGGWCPGQEIRPWVVDLTPDVVAGSPVTLDYEGLHLGEVYQPTGSQDFPARIDMESWLVIHQ